MEIKIKKNAYVFTNSSEFKSWLKANEGQYVKVETDHLFNNQYNTEKYRIYDSMIESVKNDARQGKGKCKYCGTMLDTSKGQFQCTKYTMDNPSIIGSHMPVKCSDYDIEWFTPENTYFLKYPDGIKQAQHEVLSCHDNNIKCGTYYLENFPSVDYFRIYNGHKTINFKYDGNMFYIQNGIGYKQTNHLPVPERAEKQIIKELNKLLSK